MPKLQSVMFHLHQWRNSSFARLPSALEQELGDSHIINFQAVGRSELISRALRAPTPRISIEYTGLVKVWTHLASLPLQELVACCNNCDVTLAWGQKMGLSDLAILNILDMLALRRGVDEKELEDWSSVWAKKWAEKLLKADERVLTKFLLL